MNNFVLLLKDIRFAIASRMSINVSYRFDRGLLLTSEYVEGYAYI